MPWNFTFFSDNSHYRLIVGGFVCVLSRAHSCVTFNAFVFCCLCLCSLFGALKAGEPRQQHLPLCGPLPLCNLSLGVCCGPTVAPCIVLDRVCRALFVYNCNLAIGANHCSTLRAPGWERTILILVALGFTLISNLQLSYVWHSTEHNLTCCFINVSY